MLRYERALARLIAAAVEAPADEIRPLIKIPEPGRGDFSLPCFPLAKRMRKNPAAIAAELAATISPAEGFSSVEAVGPYLNVRLDARRLVGELVPEIRAAGDRFAASRLGAGKRVVIEFSSPNIAKPLGFHHLRSTMIGNSLVRIHRALGYEVVALNFLGDWGKTFGLLAEGFRRFGDREKLEREGIAYLLDLYVRSSGEAERDPDFDAAAREMFRRQEEGGTEALELWRMIREISLREFQRIYRRLGVSFDRIDGESDYRDGMQAAIDQVARTAGVREDQGALVVEMPYDEGEPPLMLRKRDGATLYATRDIAAAVDRFERFAFDKSLYVVGAEQRRHFDLLVRALRAMGLEWADRVEYVQFGRVKGMSTRRGTVVFLEEVLDEARDRALAKMREDSQQRELDLERAAEDVGVGGVVFGDLKNLRTSDYTFDWEELLNPRGFTGICVQYAHARCCSILRKGGGAPDSEQVDPELLGAAEEVDLVKELARIPAAVEAAARELEPSRLARAVYEAARAWNRYQQAGNADRGLRVLAGDADLRRARLALVDAVRIALRRGLDLLGVRSPEAM
ncbi:MAG: arginine--tRNA ligase [Polyangia bacterium]